MIKKINKLISNISIKYRFYYILKNMNSSVDNKRIAEGTAHAIRSQGQKIGGDFVKQPKPQFLQSREKIWDELYTKQEDYLKSLPREKITITLKDGKQVEGISFETSPMELAKKFLKKSMISDLVVAKVYKNLIQ